MKSDEAALLLDDELWEELLQLTGGAAAPCYQCGVCTASCPWGLVGEQTDTVRSMLRQTQIGALAERDSIWLCTACGQCEALCPRGVPVAEVFQSLRYLLWKRRQAHVGLPSVLWSVYWNNNPWDQPPSERMSWAKGCSIPEFDPSVHEVLLYIGCTASYDRRAQQIARAVVQTLTQAGIAFGVLGEDEPCCGEAVQSVGHGPYFQELVERAVRVFEQRGVTDLITISPHCYDVFKNQYPRWTPEWAPRHYTQYLAELIRDERLGMPASFNRRVTFQDPCFLGRRNDCYDAPRALLHAATGSEILEMPRARADGLCCGGGGGRMWLETPPDQRFADLRIQEAIDTGAEILATACPYCVACLEDSVKAMKVSNLQVLDVAEIIVAALGEDRGED